MKPLGCFPIVAPAGLAAASLPVQQAREHQPTLPACYAAFRCLQRAQAGGAPGAWVVTAEGGSGWEFELLPNMGEALGEDPSPSALAPSPPASPERHHTLHPPLPCPPYYGSTGQAGAEGGSPRAAVGAGAVASSYRWCELVQEVDLLAELVR